MTVYQPDEPTEEVDLRCRDCGLYAWMFEEDGQKVHEDFYVSNELWDVVCPDDGVRRYVEDGVEFGEGNFILCIGCFEKRVGRPLTREDLSIRPQDLFGLPPSKRFKDRWAKSRGYSELTTTDYPLPTTHSVIPEALPAEVRQR